LGAVTCCDTRDEREIKRARRDEVIVSYQPMTIADLAAHLARHTDEKIRWKYVWEFLEEYRWEPAERRPSLLGDEPPLTGEERWDALLAAIAEHLTAELDQAPPAWTRSRVLATPWFPSTLPSKRTEALVWAPAAFRKHGVYLSARDLEAA
jgi:hypothetical protein